MKVIEITGVPCVGKSTIIGTLENNSGFILFNQKWLLLNLGVFSKSKTLNTITYEIYMFSSGLLYATPKISFKFFLAALRLKEPFFRRINIFRNILHKYAIHHRAKKTTDSKCLIVDEGISHIPYLFTGGLSDKNQSLFLQFPHNIEPCVIKLSVDLETVIERLRKRGHKRINSDDKNIKHFASNNEKCSNLQNKLLKNYSKVVYLSLSTEDKNTNDRASLLKSLEKCLKN